MVRPAVGFCCRLSLGHPSDNHPPQADASKPDSLADEHVLTVSVSDPVTQGEGVNAFVSYRVNTTARALPQSCSLFVGTLGWRGRAGVPVVRGCSHLRGFVLT